MRTIKEKLNNKVHRRVDRKKEILLSTLQKRSPNKQFICKIKSYRVPNLGMIEFQVYVKKKDNQYHLYKTCLFKNIKLPVEMDTTKIKRDGTTKKDLVKGEWIFSCSMKPLQFSAYDFNIEREGYPYYKSPKKDKQWDDFFHDDFTTLEGSSHSQRNCSCQRISEAYAKWFLGNEVWKLYDQFDSKPYAFDAYEREVRKLCFKHGIKYEGI